MADPRCLGCGGYIVLGPYEVPEGVIVRGDRFMHEGCVIDTAAESRQARAGCPAYLISPGW